MFDDLSAVVTRVLESPSAVVELVLGLLLLLVGRRLFWLLVGVLGFAAGLWLADSLLGLAQPGWRWIAAAAVGVLGAAAAIFLQKAAIALAGALVAGYCAWWYLTLGAVAPEPWQWLVVAAAALAGLLVARLVADVTLVVLSVLVGTILVLQALGFGPQVQHWLFFILVLVGLAVQGSGLASRRATRSSGA